MDADVIIVFTDIRGFTKWADKTEVFANLETFVRDFMALLKRHFEGFFVKPLGDGAMIVREVAASDHPMNLLAEVLQTIAATNNAFADFFRGFGEDIGHSASLLLGWSVVKGKVRKMDNDYVGPNVNKAARLCDLARPYGIVVDHDDFPYPNLSTETPRFYLQKRRLSGLDDSRVWVTEEIQNQFLPRERLRQQPEVHVVGVCLRKEKNRLEILLAKRSLQRSLYPNLWAVPGGQLAPDETFAQGVQRHFARELGIEVRVNEQHLFYEIREPNEALIPGIRFLCQWQSGEAQNSLTVSQTRWMTESELKQMSAEEFVPGLQREIAQLLKQFKAASRT